MSDEQRHEQNDTPKDAKDLLRWAAGTQRTIDFILQQQAQFQAQSGADMQKLREAHEQTEAAVARLATATLRRFESVEGEVSNLGRKMEALVDSHIRMSDELAASKRESDERLNAFIATVERLISERRDGGGGVRDE